MHKYVFALSLCLIFAGGCVKIPTDEANCKMEATPSLEVIADEALATNGFSSGEFPSPNWWEMFNDPQLNSLMYQALSDSPTISRVSAKVQAAEAEASVKKSYLLPTIGFNASVNWQYFGKNNFFRAYTPNVIPGKENEYKIDLDLNYELDFWGKNRNIYRAALGTAKAEMAEEQSAILVLTTSVASVYFKLQAELEQLELFKGEKEILAKIFQLSQLRQENAVDSTSQVLVSEEQLLAIDKNIQFSIQKVDLARHMLNMLIGQGPELSEEVSTISLNTTIEFPLPNNISSDLIARRSDLMAQIWRIEAAAHQVGAAKADFYPRVDLFALIGLDSVFVNKFFTWGSRLRQIRPAVYLPIFTGGRLRANLRERRAEFDEMIYSYNEAVLKAVQEVADQIVVLKTTNETLRIEETLLENKLQNRNFANERYKNGVGNLSSFLDMEEQVIKEQLEKISIQYQQRIAAIQLIKALGGGYCTSEVPLGCE